MATSGEESTVAPVSRSSTEAGQLSTASSRHEWHDALEDMRQLELQRKTSQAIEEGHDADIPSSAGYILNPAQERQRRESIIDRRRRSFPRRLSGLDIEKYFEDESAGNTVDNFHDDEAMIVWWESDDDPENPYNWSNGKKTANCAVVALLTFITPLASSIFAPGVPEVMQEFERDSLTIAAFVVSVYVLGFAFGPLIMAPLSEIYGRVIVYNVCNVGFTAFCVACALAPSMDTLIIFRFICGLFGCASITLGGGTIADMVKAEHRGAAMSAYTLGPIFGPIVGPIAGGFISQSLGWRWTFWLLTIAGGTLSVVSFAVLRESYAYVILERKTQRRRKETGNDLWVSKLDAGLSQADFFKRGILRPTQMFFKSPIILITSLYMALTYGYLYLMFTTMTTVFHGTYGFTAGTVGLSYLGMGVGNLIGIVLFSLTSDKYVKKKAAQAEKFTTRQPSGPREKIKPEWRLPLLPFGAAMIPFGLFIYGWTAQYHVHWIVPIIAHIPVGLGILLIFMAVQTYLVDAFTVYAASAIATNTVVRSIAGALLPLGGLPMFRSLGLGWGNSLLGFIALATVPVAVYLIKYGEHLRKKFPLHDL